MSSNQLALQLSYKMSDRLVVPLYSGERSAGTSYSVAAPKLWNSLPALYPSPPPPINGYRQVEHTSPISQV